MGDDPLGSGGYTVSRGRPPYAERGRAASFGDLPEGCKTLVLDMYQKMWNLWRYESRSRGHIGWCQRTRRRLSWTSTLKTRGSTWKASSILRARRIWPQPPRATGRQRSWWKDY